MASPFPFSAGQVLTAAQLNSIGEWTTYTPTITQSGTVTYTGNAQYCVVNELCFVNFKLTITGSGSSGNDVSVTLPVTQTFGTNNSLGVGSIFDSGPSATYSGNWYGETSTTIEFSGDWSGGSRWGSNPSIALGANDILRANLIYQVA